MMPSEHEMPRRRRVPDGLEALDDGLSIGPWRLVRRVASTAESDAYLADRTLDDGVVQGIVHLLRGGAPSEDRLARFWHACGRVNTLDSEGRARLLGSGVTTDGAPYIASEVVTGDPLAAWCEERGATLRERVELLLGACDVLGAAHAKGIAHGSLRSDTVCVVASGGVVVRDLGVGHVAASWRDGETPTPIDDVHALGALLLELLPRPGSPGLDLYRAGSRAALDAEARLGLEGGLDAVVHRALRPSHRAPYPAASALAEDLRRWLGGLPVLVDFRPGELRRHSPMRASGSMTDS